MKKQLTKGKIVKRILLSIMAVILIVVAAVFLYIKLKVLPQLQKFMNDPEVISMLNDLQQEDLDAVLNTIDGVIEDTEAISDGVQSPPLRTNAPEIDTGKAVILPTLPPENNTPEKAPKKDGGEKNGGNKMEDIQSQIPAGDMAAATALASKVDAGYILGLLSGGLTSDEKRELKEYLTSRLSAAEISKGIELYNKYSYLLK